MTSFTNSICIDAIKTDNFNKLLVRLYNFAVPYPLKQNNIKSTTSANVYEMFKLSYKSYLGTNEFLELITQLDYKRSSMINYLNETNCSFDTKLVSIDQYLTSLYQFMDVLNNQSEIIKCDRPMSFEWRGGIDRKSNDIFKSSEILFELLMTLHTKVIYKLYLIYIYILYIYV